MIRGTVISKEVTDLIIAFNQINSIPDLKVIKIENGL